MRAGLFKLRRRLLYSLSVVTGVVSGLLSEFHHLKRGESPVVSAGHTFIYAPVVDQTSDYTGQRRSHIESDSIRIYGPFTYKKLEELRVWYE